MTTKKHLFSGISVAAATLALINPHAHAQSSVTLYGEIDTGLAHVSNVGGHARYRTTAGLVDGSYWGLRGSEDLGGGTRAIFQLERGFSMTTGEAVNDHPYHVGLDDHVWGTVTLGHQYDSIYDYFAPFTLTGGPGGTAFAHPFDNDNANNAYLARNSLKYASAEFGGFRFGGMYGLSNDAGRFANNRAYSIGASYRNGPFSAGAAYLHANGRGNTANGAYDSVTLPGRGGGVFDAKVRAQDTYGVGASYAFGDATLGVAWSRSRYSGVTNAEAESGAAMPSASFSNYEINGAVDLTPAVWLAGMYTTTHGANAHWHEVALQTGYRFSKRTDMYVATAYQRAGGNATAMIGGLEPSASRSQLLIAVGLRHRF
ncbi:MAG: porin [Janthinobacterium lividum]